MGEFEGRMMCIFWWGVFWFLGIEFVGDREKREGFLRFFICIFF